MAASSNYDFSGPFFGATLITRGKQRYPLWTEKQQLKTTIKDAKAAEIALSFLAELSVTLQQGFIPIIKAKLTPPYREGISFMDSELAEWGINTLEVQFGYSSGTGQGPVLSAVFTGAVQSTEVSMGENIEITLNAQGMGALDADTKQDGLTTKDSRHGIIQRLLQGNWDQKMKRNIEVDISGVPSTSNAYKLLTDDPIDYNQGMRTDWFAAWSLICECQCWALFTGEVRNGRDVMKIVSREEALAQQSVKKFQFYDYAQGQLGPMANIYPILSASTPTTAVYLPGASVGWVATQIDERTRKVDKKLVTDKTQKPARLASTAKAAARHEEDGGNIGDPDEGTKLPVASVDSTAPQLKKMVDNEFAREQSLMGIELEIETLGCPDLMPLQVIDVDGLSARLKGTYVTTEVTHTWSGSGASTKFKCVSNTQRIYQQVVPAQGKVNAQPAKTAEQAGTVTATPKAQ
jgi:hypothetical protein